MSQRRLVTLLAVAAISLGACSTGTNTDTAPPEAAGVRVVAPAEAQELLDAEPSPVVIDVRTPGEYAEGHLEGAELVDYNAPDFRDRIATYPRDASYVIYCRSGNRSAGARAIMTELGFTDVADIDGGIVAWTGAGFPITT